MRFFLKRILNRKERKEEMPQRAQRRNTAMRIIAKNAKKKCRKERKEEIPQRAQRRISAKKTSTKDHKA
nr:hypothetical protein [Bacteroidota bacterium]